MAKEKTSIHSDDVYVEMNFGDTFKSYCSRMWLDYCDENNDPISAINRLDYDAYVERWHDWLLERWQNREL